MTTTIIQPTRWFFFSEQGGRTYQEDYSLPTFPIDENKQPNYFIVCDGMGGHAAGQVASKLSAETIASFLEQQPTIIIDAENGQRAIRAARQRLFDYVRNEDPFSSGLGTTAAFIYQNPDGTLAAVHCGDSRIYHFRKGKCLWQSKDHTYVQDLIKDGVITAEEALTHRSRNVLMRSINAGQQSNSVADTHLVQDLKAGDIFLICSDGVYDALPVERLESYLQNLDLAEFTEALREVAFKKNGDNYTAWVVEFGAAAATATTASATIEQTTATTAAITTAPNTTKATVKKPLFELLPMLLGGAIVALAFLAYTQWQKQETPTLEKPATEQSLPAQPPQPLPAQPQQPPVNQPQIPQNQQQPQRPSQPQMPQQIPLTPQQLFYKNLILKADASFRNAKTVEDYGKARGLYADAANFAEQNGLKTAQADAGITNCNNKINALTPKPQPTPTAPKTEPKPTTPTTEPKPAVSTTGTPVETPKKDD